MEYVVTFETGAEMRVHSDSEAHARQHAERVVRSTEGRNERDLARTELPFRNAGAIKTVALAE